MQSTKYSYEINRKVTNESNAEIHGRRSYKRDLNVAPGSPGRAAIRKRPVSGDREQRNSEQREWELDRDLNSSDDESEQNDWIQSGGIRYRPECVYNHLDSSTYRPNSTQKRVPIVPMAPVEKNLDLSWILKIMPVLLLIICLIFFTLSNATTNPAHPAETTKHQGEIEENRFLGKDCNDTFKHIARKFSNQDDKFWQSIYIGLKAVVSEESRPNIITFLYNDTKSLDVFQAIVDVTKQCINPSREPIILTGNELNPLQDNYGVIIETYKPQLQESRIMVVEDLQKILAVSSRAFHDICDTKSPIVERFVVYFTLRYTEKDLEESDNASHLANNLLNRLWTEIGADTASALIARVTDQTLFLKAPL
ncbi:uncharacterized protein LOC132263992 [Phlebotomus argentipes]|uniref:uncharacterized protein LOC132263992 n=1 Tax=Phlebotomus argentipes TaxID=94469 RepID=UPI0028930079|nr:uncharacterized protein LOC132263992 [Phlebotomus argentipes]